MPAKRTRHRPTRDPRRRRSVRRAPGWQRLALVPLLASVVASCAALVGFEDSYEVAPAPDPTTGGQGGDGGATASTGGSGGSGGTGGAPAPCEHDVCVGGPPLVAECDPCAAEVCAADSFCCGDSDGYWDIKCVERAVSLCDTDCCGDDLCMGPGNTCAGCAEDCGDCGCPHSVCTTGVALSAAACRGPECTTKVCDEMPECCTGFYSWTTACRERADMLCDGAGSCVEAVCAVRPSCCTSDWDSDCVDAAKALAACNTECDCATGFDVCTPQLNPGDPPLADCDPCVSAVCDADSVCCGTGWDSFCVTEASVICGIAC